MMDRREFLRAGGSLLLPALAWPQGRWELRFLRVWQNVQVRVGGVGGPLIQLSPNKGYTWTHRDANPSKPLDITQWVGHAPVIRLHARVSAGQGSPSCVMVTLFGGTERQRWSFDSEAYYEIRR
jgi:hypothetical protein